MLKKLFAISLLSTIASVQAYASGCCVNYDALNPYPVQVSEAQCNQLNQDHPGIVWEPRCPLRPQPPLPGTPLYDQSPPGSCQCPSGTAQINGAATSAPTTYLYNNALYNQCTIDPRAHGFQNGFGLVGCEVCCLYDDPSSGSGGTGTIGGIGIAPAPGTISLNPDR